MHSNSKQGEVAQIHHQTQTQKQPLHAQRKCQLCLNETMRAPNRLLAQRSSSSNSLQVLYSTCAHSCCSCKAAGSNSQQAYCSLHPAGTWHYNCCPSTLHARSLDC